MTKITILIPVYNEVNTLKQILDKVESIDFYGLEKEIILIDDYSTDGTRELYKELNYKVLYHDKNMGKGAALRTGFKEASGDIITIQDADTEYEPKDLLPLVKEVLDGKADVAYGSRFLNSDKSENFMLTHFLGNKMLTFITNLLYGAGLTDMETCYKVFRAEFVKHLNIKSNRFDFEPEITAKVLKQGAKLVEIPITYKARSFDEGKKISWKDGFAAIWALVKFRFTN
ncbi:glycosyltransferase family 2 protein [bacterium]|nr:glycosyltransferase family 2 protein [bacterium]